MAILNNMFETIARKRFKEMSDKEKLDFLTENCDWEVKKSGEIYDAEPSLIGDESNLFAIEKDLNNSIEENWEIFKSESEEIYITSIKTKGKNE